MLLVTITAMFIFLAIDLIINDLAVEIQSLVFVRIVILFIFIGIFLLLKKDIPLPFFVKLVLTLLISINCMVIFSNLSRPTDYFTHTGIDVAIIFFCYMMTSISVRARSLVSIGVSIGLLLVLFAFKEPKYNITYASYTTSIVAINIFGYWIALLLGRAKRTSYLALISEKKAREEIKLLEGVLPICSYCKNIRDDEGSWKQLEAYIDARSNAQFSHGICPDCVSKAYPNKQD